MNHPHKFYKTAIAVALFSTTVASAQRVQHRNHGFYSDLLVGLAHQQIDVECDDNYRASYDDSCTSFDGTLNLGYQFTPSFALEAGLSGFTGQILGKYIHPISPCNDLFLKAGIGFSCYETTTTTTWYYGNQASSSNKTEEYHFEGMAMIGAGASHWLNDRWALTGELNYAANSISSKKTRIQVATAKVGVSYHF